MPYSSYSTGIHVHDKEELQQRNHLVVGGLGGWGGGGGVDPVRRTITEESSWNGQYQIYGWVGGGGWLQETNIH